MPDAGRRQFITLLGSAAAAWPLAARAQQPTRRIGMLIGYSESDSEIQARLVAFRQALEGNGWKEGRSMLIDYRFAPASHLGTKGSGQTHVRAALDSRPLNHPPFRCAQNGECRWSHLSSSAFSKLKPPLPQGSTAD
jgi:hypothetical protein